MLTPVKRTSASTNTGVACSPYKNVDGVADKLDDGGACSCGTITLDAMGLCSI